MNGQPPGAFASWFGYPLYSVFLRRGLHLLLLAVTYYYGTRGRVANAAPADLVRAESETA
ncbi:hypothetical protein [Natronoglycomyces albus]|uniref:Uncharacterized protein n=1 Tax=Natronoglycomyces albus TaxID=2811108 RepID=A0A895XLX2_9ACTN|nr:hypothetical protein [Natronoglycomyces albus]QSB06344.1 hypothetical protein JQS30_05390 [Natronoglycomyces albus]